MVRAWLLDPVTNKENPRLENYRNPPEFLSLDQLLKSTGVLYWNLDVNLTLRGKGEDVEFQKIKKQRGYLHQNLVEVSPATLPNYDAKLEEFYTEHLHADEEIRFVLAGSGYFDVRRIDDEWIRIEVSTGDLIILPAGIYHRFTLDQTNYIKAYRLSCSEPLSIHHNRPDGDQEEIRKEYLNKLHHLHHQG